MFRSRLCLLPLLPVSLMLVQSGRSVSAFGGDKLFLNAAGVTQLNLEEVRSVERNDTDAEGWIVAFYAPWCGHCQHYAPEFREFGAALASVGDSIRAGVVSCTAEKKACQEFGVKGYPTVKAFGVLGSNVVVEGRRPPELLGRVRRRYPGYLPDDAAALLKRAAKGKSPKAAGGGPLRRPAARAAPYASDAAASLRYALETAVFKTDGAALSDTRLVALRGVLAAVSTALPSATVAPALLVCLGRSPTLRADDWDAWLRVPDAVSCNATRKPARTHPKAWSPRCDPDRSGPEGGGVYTCGLWSLFHSLAAAPPDVLEPRAGRAAIRAFVEHFFGCQECRDHFLAMYDGCAYGRCDADVDNAIWLWKTHNAVNARVKGGVKDPGPDDPDRADQPWAWPTDKQCPDCRHAGRWNEPQVKAFLDRSFRRSSPPVRFAPQTRHASVAESDDDDDVARPSSLSTNAALRLLIVATALVGLCVRAKTARHSKAAKAGKRAPTYAANARVL